MAKQMRFDLYSGLAGPFGLLMAARTVKRRRLSSRAHGIETAPQDLKCPWPGSGFA